MLNIQEFAYKPHDGEAEKASNSYVMSLIALMVGMPLPIINLIATFIFFIGNRQSTYFVRWHSTQALLSQISVLIINSVAFTWTIQIFVFGHDISNLYIGYILTALLYNLTEFIITIYTAIQVRKGTHIEWFLYGPMSNNLVRS